MKEGGSPTLEEDNCQSLLFQVFSLNPFLAFLFCLPSPLCLLPMVLLRLFNLLKGLFSCTSQSSLVGVEHLEAEGLQKIEFTVVGQRLRTAMMSLRQPGPWSPPHWVIHPCLRDIGVCHQLQPKSVRLQPQP